MKILNKKHIQNSRLLFSPRSYSLFTAVVISLLCIVNSAHAQTDKQISYPVKVPVVIQAAASSTPAPVLKAPEPVIRPIDEASTTPPRPKAPVKKTTTKVIVDEQVKTPAAKSVANKKSASEKKSTAAATKNTATTKKSTVKTSVETPPVTAKKAVAIVNPKPAVAATEKKTLLNPPVEKINAPLTATLATTAAVVALTPITNLNDEEQLADNVSESEELNPESEEMITSPTPRMNNSALPMSNKREGFVIDFQRYVETKIVPKVPGLALAIIADGKVKVLQGYGLRKYGSSELVNTDTAFRLASVSKSFGSSAAAMLVRDGLINWETTVRSVLPEVEFSNPRYGDQLTVRDILSQSTGLPTQTNSNFIEEGLPFDEVVRRLRYVNFVCPPGKCYNYQNVTYSLISNIIYKKTGKTYEQYVAERIFNPLGMRTASVGLQGLKANNNYALPHVVGRKGWLPAEVTENYYRINPAAGVNASIADMSRWVLAHMGHNPNVLQPGILNAVHAKVTRNTPAQNHYGSREGVTDSHYGLGWRVFDYRGDKNFVHHGGGVMGFRSEVVFNPELQIGMVVLTNTQRLGGDIIFEFLDAYEDEKRGERKKVAATIATPKKPALKKKDK